jgi:hypothetical protein
LAAPAKKSEKSFIFRDIAPPRSRVLRCKASICLFPEHCTLKSMNSKITTLLAAFTLTLLATDIAGNVSLNKVIKITRK